jgi:peptidyl-prolyl cis-trans isomerase C
MNARTCRARVLAGAALTWLAGGDAPARAQQPVAVPASATAVKPAAVVNGEPISMAELEAVLKQAPMAVEMPEPVRVQMRRHALAMLIDDTLMQQFIKANAPQVPKAEVDQKMAEMDADLKKEKKSVEAFCKENGQTVEELRDGLTWMLRWTAWAKGKISDADVRRYYEAYKDYFDGTTVRVSHIAVRLGENASEADHARAKAQLTELRAQIIAGKVDFAAAAKTYSQCESSKAGGDLGFVARKTMVEEAFAHTAFAMQPGQVSDVVQTGFGMHLIKVIERKPGQPSDFAKIKEQVRDIYTEEYRLTILAQQRKAAKLEINIP